MAISGSCLCGNVKIELTGEPRHLAICHCLDDRKISGSLFSYSCNFPKSQFKILSDSTLKTFKVQSDHQSELTNYFCSNCGVTLWRAGGTMGEDIVNIKGGVLDDQKWLDAHGTPRIEVYVDRRVAWLPKLEGTIQLNSKYEVTEGTVPPGLAKAKEPAQS